MFNPSETAFVGDFQENMVLTGHTITGNLKKIALPVFDPNAPISDLGIRVIMMTPSEEFADSIDAMYSTEPADEGQLFYICGMRVTEESGDVIYCLNTTSSCRPTMNATPDPITGRIFIVGEVFIPKEVAADIYMGGYEDVADYVYTPENSEDIAKVELLYVPLTADELAEYATAVADVSIIGSAADLIGAYTELVESKGDSVVSYDITALKEQVFYMDSSPDIQTGMSAHTLNASIGNSAITSVNIPESLQSMFQRPDLPNWVNQMHGNTPNSNTI